MLGYVKGYDVKNISLKKAEKEYFTNALGETGVSEDTYDKILNALKSKGAVYAWYKKKTIVALYMVERVESYIPETEEKETTNDKSKDVKKRGTKSLAALRISELYINSDVQNLKEEFDKSIRAEVRERIIFSEDEKIIEWNGQLEYPSKISFRGLNISLYLIPMSLGLLFGIINNHLSTGIMFGVSFGLLFALYGFGNKSVWELAEATEENKLKAVEAVRNLIIGE